MGQNGLKHNAPKNNRKRLNLALQGGGAHGAFTWGVLDRLMRDGRIFIDGISGTSAGAMNGVVFTDGFIKNGRMGAIDSLHAFWKAISERALMSSSSAFMPWLNPGGQNRWNVDDSPAFVMADV